MPRPVTFQEQLKRDVIKGQESALILRTMQVEAALTERISELETRVTNLERILDRMNGLAMPAVFGT